MPDNNRRGFMLGAGGAALSSLSLPVIGAGSNRISRDEFMVYIRRFNANDPSFIEFYHPDVVLELGDSQIVGASGIRDFYANVKQYIRETIDVTQFVSDENGIAVELPTRFECFNDWENSFWGVPLKAGQVMRIVSFVMYEIQDRKFSHIKSARYRVEHDWRMEE